MSRKFKRLLRGIICFVLCLSIAPLWPSDFSHYLNVRDFGARGTGEVYDTQAVQAAIDSAHSRGGGVVYFPPGKYLLKTVVLKNNVTVQIDRGAVILGSTELTAFMPEFGSFRDSGGRKFGLPLFFAMEAKNITLRGEGVIDGQGDPKFYPAKKDGKPRPSIIRFVRCQNVRIEGLTLINSAAWVQHYVNCDDVVIRGITVNSYINRNNDGIDMDGCQRVLITQCNVSSDDDAIVLKSLSTRPCKDVVISDCLISGNKSAIKMGTESVGGFQNISIANCTFYRTRGISIFSVDGGIIDNITVANITMRDTYGVLALRLGARMRPYEVPPEKRPRGPGPFRNIMVTNVQATGVTESNCFIAGIPGHPIENVSLNHIRIEYLGKGKREDSFRSIPERIDGYPKGRMFGTLPAYGFYVRYARNVRINDFNVSFVEPDYRSVIFCEDVIGLELNHLAAPSSEKSAPFIWFRDVQEARVQNCLPKTVTDCFLKIEGEGSRGIVLLGNQLSRAQQKLQLEKGAKKREIVELMNY